MNLHCQQWILNFDFWAFCIREEKRREKEEGEKWERERAQMGEIDFADTQIEEKERELLFLLF